MTKADEDFLARFIGGAWLALLLLLICGGLMWNRMQKLEARVEALEKK
jgi:hypothetical protein